MERYGKVVTSIANFRIVPRGGGALIEVIPGDRPRLGLTMTNELALAAAVSLSREVGGDAFAPASVHLTGPAVPTAEHKAHFGCPIHPGSDRDALEVGLDVLKRPNRLGDAGIAAFFDDHLDHALGEIEDPGDLSRQVQDQISDALSEGVPTVTYVAGRLGMSGRTLQRRLAEAGLAYQNLAAGARQKLAEQLLRQTDYALAEVAFMTGFSDQSTFTRAFKRWSGQTPASYRRDG